MKAEDPEEEIKKLAPNLFSQEKKNLFQVPDDYFENLPSLIRDRILQEKKAPWYETLLSAVLKPRIAIAFVFLAILAAGSWYFYKSQTEQHAPMEMAFTLEELKSTDLIGDIDEFILAEEIASMEDSDTKEITSDAELEDYLIDNNTDLNKFINEL